MTSSRGKVKDFIKPTPMKDYPEFKSIRNNISKTRPVFGKGIVGQSRKYLAKVPGRYKVGALAIAGVVGAGMAAKNKMMPTPKPTKINYTTKPSTLNLSSKKKT